MGRVIDMTVSKDEQLEKLKLKILELEDGMRTAHAELKDLHRKYAEKACPLKAGDVVDVPEALKRRVGMFLRRGFWIERVYPRVMASKSGDKLSLDYIPYAVIVRPKVKSGGYSKRSHCLTISTKDIEGLEVVGRGYDALEDIIQR